jgi:hypothetical protein
MWGPIELLLALFAAAATALLLGLFAHDAMGMSIDVIRIDALGGATLIFGVVAGGSMLGGKRVSTPHLRPGMPPIKSSSIRSADELLRGVDQPLRSSIETTSDWRWAPLLGWYFCVLGVFLVNWQTAAN